MNELSRIHYFKLIAKNIKQIFAMKYLNQSSTALLFILTIVSCKKDNQLQQQASLNVVNAAINVASVKVNYFGESVVYATFDPINYGANKVYTVGAGSVFITIVPTADTLNPIYDKTILTEAGGVYSLFLAGQSPIVDTLFVTDAIPYRSDSSAGVRFINLSVNSSPVSINILGNPNGSEVASLPYKTITDFKTYPARSANGTYKFEVRDATSGALLVTYSLSTPRFNNVTLVLKGLLGGSGSTVLGIQRVNNY